MVQWDLMERLVLQDQSDQLETKDQEGHWEIQDSLEPRGTKDQKEQLDRREILGHQDLLDCQLDQPHTTIFTLYSAEVFYGRVYLLCRDVKVWQDQLASLALREEL